MSDTAPIMRLVGTDADAALPSGRWITAAVASERSGLVVGHVNRLCLEDWQHRGLARMAKLPSGQKGWEVDEAADTRFAAGKSHQQRAAEFDWNTIPEAARKVGLFRLGLLTDFRLALTEGVRRCEKRDETINRFIRDRRLSLSARTLQRFDQRWREMGTPNGLLDQRLVNTPVPITSYAPFYELLKSIYLEFGNARPAPCYHFAAARAIKDGIDVPCIRQATRFLATINPGEAIANRLGPKAFDDRCAAHCERDFTQIRVMEGHGENARPTVRPMESNDIWCADHHICDVMVLRGGEIIRPWLTVWQDLRSRKIVGYIWSFRSPNSATIMLCLREAVLRNGLRLPKCVYTDNGKDFDAWMWDGKTKRERRQRIKNDQAAFGGVYGQLRIGHIHARPYNAKAKPVERWFRTFEEQFGVFQKSYCGGSTDRKPERLAEIVEKGHLPQYEDFIAEASVWIDDVFAHQPHTGQGMDGRRPNEVYEANIGTIRTTSREQLDCCLLQPNRPAKVGRNGIKVRGRTYGKNDPALRQIFGQWVLLRIDPNDINTAQVWSQDGNNRICEVRCNELQLMDTTPEPEFVSAVQEMNTHNKMLAKVQKRGMRRVESPTQILAERAIQAARAAQAADPLPPNPDRRYRMIDTGIDSSTGDQTPLKKAVGAEMLTRQIDPTLAMFAEDD